MIKVLFYISTLEGGGAEKVLVNLLNNMNKKNFDITLLTTFDIGINKKDLSNNIKYKSIFRKFFKGSTYIQKIFSPEYLYRRIIKEDYDIVISYSEGPTTRMLSGLKNKKTKKINWVHRELTKQEVKKTYRNYKEFEECYKKYDATVFVSKSAKAFFENEFNLYGNNIVKYNTIESEKIKENSHLEVDDVVFDDNKMNMITVGNLKTVKGYDRLLRIAKKLKEKKYNFHLYILGEGKMRKKMEKYISENNLNEYITLLGYKNNPYKYIKACDLYVCSSYSEAFSTSITESLIIGTPVITTLCSGMEELLGSNNEYGIIVQNQEKDLYQGIKSILQDKELLDYYTIKSKERGSFFSTKKTVNDVEKLLTSLYYE